MVRQGLLMEERLRGFENRVGPAPSTFSCSCGAVAAFDHRLGLAVW